MKYYFPLNVKSNWLVATFLLLTANAFATTNELSGFEAHTNGQSVAINWVAEHQIDNAYFTIEKSKDGVTFEEVAVIAGAGTCNGIIEYYELDNNPWEGISYYRLKQTGMDGKLKHFNIVPVAYYPSNEPNMSVFPDRENNGKIPVDLNKLKGNEYVVVLRDDKGKEVHSRIKITATENDQLIAVDLENCVSEGTFLVTSANINELYSRQLTIKAE